MHGYKHTEFGKRVEGIYRPKRLQDEGVGGQGTDTQALGKGLEESMDPRGCKMRC